MSTEQLVSANRTAVLTTLLPTTTYTLAYTLPLLLCSLCLTFAGAFLTLDRSCAFPPTYDSLPGDLFPQKRTRKLHWLLEGGIGGLTVGYVFGVHLSTFLSLMIPCLSSSAPLSPKSFIPVWLLSAFVTTFPSGRWRYGALIASGISGGSTLSLALAVILHPSLLTRIILTVIITPSLTVLTFLPLRRFQHSFLRLSISSAGAFGVVLCIGLLAGVESWANVWERFWVAEGEWGSSSEKGLSAAYCFLISCGMMCDWMLRHKFGENPDQKWDSYLATYSQNLPDRVGTFQPPTSVLSRFFGLGQHAAPLIPTEIVFPTDLKPKSKISTLTKLHKDTSILRPLSGFEFQTFPAYLKKERSRRIPQKRVKKTRDPVKFGGDLPSFGSDSEEDEWKTPLGYGMPWLDQGRSFSPPVSVGTGSLRTIEDHDDIDVEMEAAKAEAELGVHQDENREYSDFEEDDVTSAMQRNRGFPEWSPDFLSRHSESGATPTTSQRAVVEQPSALEGAVPMTPSLIKAIDRITVARQDAYGAVGKSLRPSESSGPAGRGWLPGAKAYPPFPVPGDEGDNTSQKWDLFWREVREKAALAQ